jgi:hypothetical protein
MEEAQGVVVGKGWTRMIVDGRVGAEVRCRESRQDRRPGEYVSRGHGRAS